MHAANSIIANFALAGKRVCSSCKLAHSSASLHRSKLTSCRVMLWLQPQECLHLCAMASTRLVSYLSSWPKLFIGVWLIPKQTGHHCEQTCLPSEHKATLTAALKSYRRFKTMSDRTYLGACTGMHLNGFWFKRSERG